MHFWCSFYPARGKFWAIFQSFSPVSHQFAHAQPSKQQDCLTRQKLSYWCVFIMFNTHLCSNNVMILAGQEQSQRGWSFYLKNRHEFRRDFWSHQSINPAKQNGKVWIKKLSYFYLYEKSCFQRGRNLKFWGWKLFWGEKRRVIFTRKLLEASARFLHESK